MSGLNYAVRSVSFRAAPPPLPRRWGPASPCPTGKSAENEESELSVNSLSPPSLMKLLRSFTPSRGVQDLLPTVFHGVHLPSRIRWSVGADRPVLLERLKPVLKA